MERLGTLINKLKEQFDQQAEPSQMAITAQLVLAELQPKAIEPINNGKVAVVMPAIALPAQQTESPAFPVEHKPVKKEEQSGWLFEEPMAIPTLIHQDYHQAATDINAFLGGTTNSVNDRLKQEETEVATMLEEAPIRDLKKAISINDRYLFINNLFRGDENMYERSIRTINGFNIYPEAQYWIQRELKVKLSWEENSEPVKLFDQLVKRRFA
ncbi:MAG: hypothetical protein IKD55_01335 [Sediminibacterium sp.]|nr:hypothetical protein [Sediminibacterium sp.]